MRHRSFTLIEILLAIVVLLILAGIVIGGVSYATAKADEAKTRSVMEEFKMALEKYKAAKGVYPVQTTAGEVNLSDSCWNRFRNYYEAQNSGQLLDGYDQPFYYQYPGNHNKKSYDLWSIGPDGAHGIGDESTEGVGNIRKAGEEGSDDICNWRQ